MPVFPWDQRDRSTRFQLQDSLNQQLIIMKRRARPRRRSKLETRFLSDCPRDSAPRIQIIHSTRLKIRLFGKEMIHRIVESADLVGRRPLGAKTMRTIQRTADHGQPKGEDFPLRLLLFKRQIMMEHLPESNHRHRQFHQPHSTRLSYPWASQQHRYHPGTPCTRSRSSLHPVSRVLDWLQQRCAGKRSTCLC